MSNKISPSHLQRAAYRLIRIIGEIFYARFYVIWR
jgi:hypothetical protein